MKDKTFTRQDLINYTKWKDFVTVRRYVDRKPSQQGGGGKMKRKDFLKSAIGIGVVAMFVHSVVNKARDIEAERQAVKEVEDKLKELDGQIIKIKAGERTVSEMKIEVQGKIRDRDIHIANKRGEGA